MASRILIIRTSALGDIVHCLPVLSALRRDLPTARIAWVVEKTFAPLLEGHPDIDELIVVRLREWRKRLFSSEVRGEIAAFRRALRRFAPEVALDLMGNHKGGAIARLSGASRRLGAARRLRREGSSVIWINEPVGEPSVESSAAVTAGHAVDRALAVLDGLDLPTDRGPADFGGDKVLTEVPEDAQAFLDARQRPFVIIQAGAGWANKTYPPERWGEVARQLRERVGVAVWVPIAPGEEHLAQAVVEASDGAARAVEAYAFAFLAALLRASRLVLGGDTGPLHLAQALGTPVLCLIGPTDPKRNGPYGMESPMSSQSTLSHRTPPQSTWAPGQVIFKPLPCSYCYKRYAEPKACLLNISAQEVADRAIAIIDGYKLRGSDGDIVDN